MKIIALNQAYYFNINKITRNFFVCKIVYFEENIYNISPKSFFPFLKVAQLLMKSFLAMKSSIDTLFYVLPELQGKMCDCKNHKDILFLLKYNWKLFCYNSLIWFNNFFVKRQRYWLNPLVPDVH